MNKKVEENIKKILEERKRIKQATKNIHKRLKY